MKTQFKIIGLVLGLPFLGVLAIGVISLHTVPSAQDAKISEAIRYEFTGCAATNLSAGKSIKVISSPRRGATILIIEGNLVIEEKHKMELLAEQVGHRNENRKVTVVFR